MKLGEYMEFEFIKKEVEKRISPARMLHSYGVAKRAEELAKIYGENPQTARIVGIAHDIAKEMTKEEAIKYIQENQIILDEIEQFEYSLWHSKIGAKICEKEFGFTQEMSQAILYHTTGNVNMNQFDKIIYLADKTEENRNFIDLEKAIEISNTDLNGGIVYVSEIAIRYSMKKQSLIHPDTIHLRNELIKQKRNMKLQNE